MTYFGWVGLYKVLIFLIFDLFLFIHFIVLSVFLFLPSKKKKNLSLSRVRQWVRPYVTVVVSSDVGA